MAILKENVLRLDYNNEPKRDILCIDIKSFFASVEAVERNLNPHTAMIAVISKPDNNGGLVLAASPRVKEKYNVRTGTRVYEIPKNADIDVVEPRMALYLKKNLDIIVANEVGRSDRGFNADENQVILFTADGDRIDVPLTAKSEVANIIIRKVIEDLNK